MLVWVDEVGIHLLGGGGQHAVRVAQWVFVGRGFEVESFWVRGKTIPRDARAFNIRECSEEEESRVIIGSERLQVYSRLI